MREMHNVLSDFSFYFNRNSENRGEKLNYVNMKLFFLAEHLKRKKKLKIKTQVLRVKRYQRERS